MTQIDCSITDLFEQGRKQICQQIYNNQFDTSTYPENFEKSKLEEINDFINKLVILEPIDAFEIENKKFFRILKTIVENKDNKKIVLYNTENLDKFGIRVYIGENDIYLVRVKDKDYNIFICPPDPSEISACVFNYLKLNTYNTKRMYKKFKHNIKKTLMEI